MGEPVEPGRMTAPPLPIEVPTVSSASRNIVVLALAAGEALSLAAEAKHPLVGWLDRVTAVVVGVPADADDPDRRGADPTVLVAHLARRFPSARWFATASLARDFPYNLARRIGSLSNTTSSRAGLALVPGLTRLPTTRAAVPDELVSYGATAIRGLWESWPLDTIVADRRSRVFVDSARISRVDQHEVFSVRGPLQVPVDTTQTPPIAVWGERPVPGIDLAFTSGGSIRDAEGCSIGTVVAGPAEASVQTLLGLEAAGRLPTGSTASSTTSLRTALGLPPAEPVLTAAAPAFPETAVLQ